MPTTHTVDATAIQQLLNEHSSETALQEQLLALGLEQDLIAQYTAEFIKRRNLKRVNMGAVFMAAGALLGLISCVLAIVDPVPEWHNFFLFGVTSAAILIACYGLYLVFE